MTMIVNVVYYAEFCVYNADNEMQTLFLSFV
jgi:hypothetical protein